MRKSVLTGLLAVAALSVYADEPTYNLFDPADCDAEGWLWLDTPEKIAKYVGADKKIQLISAPYEIEDPDFPGEMINPAPVADATLKGYNDKGEEGGEGSKTGGIIIPATPSHDWGDLGGGILIQMPDCALFELYLSQSLPDVYTWLEGGYGYLSASDLKYIWNEDEPWWLDPDAKPLSSDYVAWDLNMQDIKYLNYDDYPEFCIYGAKGNPRTAGFYNYSLCPMYVQGLRIKTFTDVSMDDTSVEGIIADADITVNGKAVTLSAPAEISVYNAAGVKVASVYGTSLDCSVLNGLYIVKAGNKAVKVNF